MITVRIAISNLSPVTTSYNKPNNLSCNRNPEKVHFQNFSGCMDNVDESSIHESIYESKFFPWQLPLDCASLSLKIMIRFPFKAVFSGSKVAIVRSFFH